MRWFRKESTPKDPTPEIQAHKRATKRKVTEVKKASEDLNHQLEENGFTLQIALAMGAKHTGSKR